MNGTIKSLVRDRKFGFISREGEENDLFFHASKLSNVEYTDLQEGDQVTFDIEQGDKGPSATNVARA